MTQSVRTSLSLLSVSTFLVLLISCGSSRNANIERGTGYNFQAGYPEFRASAFGFIDENKGPTLQLSIDLVKGSLIYMKEGDSLSANFSLDYQVQDVDDSDHVLASKHLEKKVKSTDRNIINSRETVSLDFSMQVDPSKYKIVVQVKDLNSGKHLAQNINANIPATETGAYTLSKVQMYGKINGENEWDPINTYDVKGKIDSLRFVVQVISKQTNEQMRVNSRLINFDSDTSYARPMNYANYSPSSIEYKGIDYDEKTEIESNQRILTDYSSVFIEYKFANQQRGNYQFEVRAQKENAEEEIFKARSFGVKSKNYPALKSPRELAGPMIYLMGKNKYKDLMSISDSDSLKQAIDRYWLQKIGNADKARNVIKMYYQRVEEANKQFSNFKEGWKTDLGMIYILFGPPWYTEDHLRNLYWFYSYNRSDPEYSYYFYQPKLKDKYFPFYHYVFQRDNYYYSIQYRQRELWLTGLILQRNI